MRASTVTPPWEKTDQAALSTREVYISEIIFYFPRDLSRRICDSKLNMTFLSVVVKGQKDVGLLVGKPLGHTQQEISIYRASNPQLEPGAVLTRGGRWAKSSRFPLGKDEAGPILPDPPTPQAGACRSRAGGLTPSRPRPPTRCSGFFLCQSQSPEFPCC
jgi:hypothetical protein